MITMQDINNNTISFTLAMVGDWAIYARANDLMLEFPDMTEDEAIRTAVEEENDHFRYAMRQIKAGEIYSIEAVHVDNDGNIDIDDDYYTDEHMVEIREALEVAIVEAREAEESEKAYEAMKEYLWFHR